MQESECSANVPSHLKSHDGQLQMKLDSHTIDGVEESGGVSVNVGNGIAQQRRHASGRAC